jgi:aspartyl-tRNA(Asn)/glutamyl-tRNA(Gln) amidotransferase subunit C
MATAEEVKKLAALARIRVEDKELEKFTREFDAILAYVGQLEKLELSNEKETKPALRNVMRKDGEPNTPGMYTEKVVKQFPASDKNALIVKQIISHEKTK